MDIETHAAYMYGWRLWERGKPRPRGLVNRAGWDAARKAHGAKEKVPVTEYAETIMAVREPEREDDGNILRSGRR
ncbi:MAG: hypothetical protein ACOYD4_11750 [Solirubrobacterales bacterium]